MKNLQQRLQEYEDLLLLRNFSKNTRSSYLRTIQCFDQFISEQYPGHPYSQDLAKAYLLDRIKSGMSWSTINCDYSALRKYFREVAQLPWCVKKIPRPRKHRLLPEILSMQDVVKLIEHGLTFKHQVFLTFVYATGLRLSEAVNITLNDIDGHRLQVRVRGGKGGKDRYVVIPQCLLQILRVYYKAYKPKLYLFNGRKKGSRYSPRSAQWCIIRARQQANITKKATIHTLRHCYATHHLENGTDLVFIQRANGAQYVKTTARYVHLCLHRVSHIHHPIEQIPINYLRPIQ